MVKKSRCLNSGTDGIQYGRAMAGQEIEDAQFALLKVPVGKTVVQQKAGGFENRGVYAPFDMEYAGMKPPQVVQDFALCLIQGLRQGRIEAFSIRTYF